MPQADHEVAYELRKAFDKFVELRKELRNRGFNVSHPANYDRASWYLSEDFDQLEIKKLTVVTY